MKFEFDRVELWGSARAASQTQTRSWLRRGLKHRAASGLAALLLAGCNVLPEPQVDSVRYFTLSEPVAEAHAGGVHVRPVQLAGHLRNRAMAVRLDENEVIYLEDVRWAESLDEAITQLLRTQLAGVGEGRSLLVQIQRCEVVRSKDNAVEFAATYTIRGDGGHEEHGAFVASPRRWEGTDYGALVGMLRETTKELAEDVAGKLN